MMRCGRILIPLLLVGLSSVAGLAAAQADVVLPSLAGRVAGARSQPTWWRVVLLEDYNTRVVLLGTTLLGFAAGTVGSFTLLRKRALMGDALSHATLPGIGAAFMLATAMGYGGKALPVLLLGAAFTGVLGMLAILVIRNLTRLKEDAALGIVLSVFFGGGVAVLGVIQQMQAGHAAGLEAFIYGKTASMVASDAWLIGCAGSACVALSMLLFKELTLLCFDEGYAGARGLPVVGLDLVLMSMVVVVTIVGLQAVGLILMIALLVIPAAAARFWTERMSRMAWVAALVGALSCLVGAALSAIVPRLPSGAMIVLVAAAMFVFSMIFGRSRGVLLRFLRRHQLNRKIDRQHLLRGMYERLEATGTSTPPGAAPISFAELLAMRSWTPTRLRRQIRRAEREGLVYRDATARLGLTAAGLASAARTVRDHRLWELYLITHADVAPSKVDRDADAIEHVLDAAMIAQLESLLAQQHPGGRMPLSPHRIASVAGSAARGDTPARAAATHDGPEKRGRESGRENGGQEN